MPPHPDPHSQAPLPVFILAGVELDVDVGGAKGNTQRQMNLRRWCLSSGQSKGRLVAVAAAGSVPLA